MSEPVQGKRLRITRLDCYGAPIENSTVEVGGSFEGTGVEPGEWLIPEDLDASALETFSMDMQFLTPDPALLDPMTGGWNVPTKAHSVEVRQKIPVRRRAWQVVWEWLRRTPRQYTDRYIYIPHAEVSRNPDGSITFTPSTRKASREHRQS